MRTGEPEDASASPVLQPPTATAAGLEWRQGEFVVSTDPDRLDVPLVTRVLAGTYWAAEIAEHTVRRSIANSIAFGLYRREEQVGFARAVTDRATFAWLSDVFVVDDWRRRGLGLFLVRCVLAHPELQGLRRWMLGTRDAHRLYEQLGFRPVRAPERLMEILDPDVHRRQAAAVRADESETAPGPAESASPRRRPNQG